VKTLVIYKYRNLINGKEYVGQTNNFKDRSMNHKSFGNKKCLLDRAINKYGIKNFSIRLVDVANDDEDLNRKEQFYIHYFDCKYPKGYNLTDGGTGRRGYNVSEETKRKISKANKGKIRSEEVRMKMSESSKGSKNNNYGKIHTDEAKIKISKANIGSRNGRWGVKLTEEQKRRVSEVHTNKIVTDETRKKISEGNKGKKLKEETKKKLSEMNKGKKLTKESIRKRTETLKRKRIEKLLGEFI
jgi:group I intron endonuclease